MSVQFDVVDLSVPQQTQFNPACHQFSRGGPMKVTFEFNKCHGSEVRWQRMLDIIRRDLEKQSIVRYSQSDLANATPSTQNIPHKRSQKESITAPNNS